MPAASKVQHLPEALAWLRQGRTYQWIVDEYVWKYGVQTTASMWSVLRRRHGIEHRIVRDRDLIPWHVDPAHRHGHDRASTPAWRYVPRREGIDLDLIREPKVLTRDHFESHSQVAVEIFVVYDNGRKVPFDPLLLEPPSEHPR